MGLHESTPAPGEMDFAHPDPATQHITKRVTDWFDHYLHDRGVSTGPEFSYFRDWVTYAGIATPAYASSGSFPVGRARSLYLSGARDLVTARTDDGLVQAFELPGDEYLVAVQWHPEENSADRRLFLGLVAAASAYRAARTARQGVDA